MTEFYVSGAGKSGWNIPDISHKKSMMAAKYQDHYFRVLVTGVATQEVVTGLFIDYGTSSEIAITELRWLRKVFLSLPAQTHSVRLWGTRQGRVLKSLPKMETWMDSLSQLSKILFT